MEKNQQMPENELATNNDQQVLPENQQVPTTKEKAKSTRKKISRIVIVFLTLVLTGAGSWLFFSAKMNAPRKSEQNEEQEIEETPQTTESIIIEEFKTYTNEKQKFQFTYPRELKFEQLIVFSDEPTHYRVVYTGNLQTTPVEKEEDLIDGYIFRVAAHDNVITPIADLTEMKREKFTRDCPESAQIGEKVATVVNGEKGFVFSVENCKQNYIQYIINYYGKVYEIAQVYKGDVGFKLTYQGRLNDIMSTFRFIRDKEPIDPDGLKAYTNINFGFSFRHPYLNTDCCTIPGPTGKGITYLLTMAGKEEGVKDFKGKVNGIAVFVDKNDENLEFEDYMKIQREKLVQEYRVIVGKNPKPVEEEIELDGKKAYRLREYAWWGDAVFVPLKTNKQVLIIAESELDEGGFEESFRQILSTFKFIPKEQ